MPQRIYYFETLEIYRLANQLARLVGAVGASLERRHERKVRHLIDACVAMTMAIAGGNAEVPQDEQIPLHDRLELLRSARDSAQAMRCTFLRLQKQRLGSRPHITAALELLERMDNGLSENAELISNSFVPRCK